MMRAVASLAGLLFAIGSILTGCAASGPNALARREAAPLPVVTVKGVDGFFETKVSAAPLGEVIATDSADIVRLSLGEGAEARCWFFREELNLGAGMAAVTASALEDVEDFVGSLSSKRVETVSVAAAGDRPYLSVNWSFLAEKEGEPWSGRLRIMLGTARDHSIACVRTGFGYRDTLDRVFEELLLETRFPGAEPKTAHYTRIDRIERDGVTIGVQRMRIMRDADGDDEISTEVALVTATDAGLLSTADSHRLEFSTPTGRLINAFRGNVVAGRMISRLELKPLREGGWRVSGTHRNEALDARLPAAKPRSSLGRILEIERAIADEGVEARGSFTIWEPDINPTEWRDVSFRIQEHLPDDSYRIVLESDPWVIHGVSDSSGSMKTQEHILAGEGTTLRRIYQAGDP
jgi:hypothetical protein